MADSDKNGVARETLINTALKEYEALRKEIDARTDATRNYGWPVIAVAFGATALFKAGGLDDNVMKVALVLIPAVGMTIAALAANAQYDMNRARRGIADLEERIFKLSLRDEVALCHETCRVARWEDKAEKEYGNARKWAAGYACLEAFLWLTLLPLPSSWGGVSLPLTAILLGVLGAPLVIFIRNSRLDYDLRKEPYASDLLDHIRRFSTASPPPAVGC